MKIDKDQYYAIVCKEGNNIYKWFNNRVYLGRWVMLAYNQIKDKEKYSVCLINCLTEVLSND